MAVQTLTFYEILEIPLDASPTEVKAAYRRRSKDTHPDSGGTSVTEFVRVHEAYNVLADPVERSAYDRSLLQVTTAKSLSTDQSSRASVDTEPAHDSHAERTAEFYQEHVRSYEDFVWPYWNDSGPATDSAPATNSGAATESGAATGSRGSKKSGRTDTGAKAHGQKQGRSRLGRLRRVRH